MAQCEYKAPNKKESELFSKLENQFGTNIAINTYKYVQYADTSKLTKDANGEPLLSELVFNNMIITSSRLNKHNVSEEQLINNFAKLQENFTAGGLEIVLERNDDIEESARRISRDGKYVIQYNPSKAKADSIYHEFGHILIDSMGYESGEVQAGIQALRGTNLWKEMKTLYPEYSRVEFEKEVLTTALGAQSLKFANEVDESRWKFWLKTFMRKLGELLGLSVPEVNAFARLLISDKITDAVHLRYLAGIQRQRDLRIVNDVFQSKQQFLEKARNEIQQKIFNHYKHLSEVQKTHNVNYKELKELEEELTHYAQLDNDQGIIAFLTQMYNQTSRLENRLLKILNPSQEDIDSGAADINAKILRQLVNYNSIFALIKDIEDIVYKDEPLQAKLKERQIGDTSLYHHIQTISSRYTQINRDAQRLGLNLLGRKLTEHGVGPYEGFLRDKLEREYNSLHADERKAAKAFFSDDAEKTYREKRRKWVNAKIAAERDSIGEIEAQKFIDLLQQSPGDISWLESMFMSGDAINDDIIQVGSEMLDRADFRTMNESVDEYKKMDELFTEYAKEHGSSNMQKKYDPLIADEWVVDPDTGEIRQTGKKSQMLVSQFHYAFYEEQSRLWDLYKKVSEEFGETSQEALDAKKAANDFTRANTKSRFTDDYYRILDSLEPRFNAVIQPLKEQRSSILRKYKIYTFEDGRRSEIYDLDKITEEDRLSLASINREMKQAASIYDARGELKTGFALELAKALTAYNERISSLYTDSSFASRMFEQEKTKAEAKGNEALEKWMKSNTSDKINDLFYRDLAYYMTILGGSSNVYTKQIRAILKQFKNADGTYGEVPADVKSRVLEIHAEFYADVQERLEEGFDGTPNPDIERAIIWLQNNMSYKTTQQYEIDAQDARDRGLYDMWYSTHHVLNPYDGNMEPAPYYTQLWPKDESKYVARDAPNSNWMFSEIKSEFLNPDVSVEEHGQPNERWLNPQWSALERDRQNNGVTSRMYDHMIRLIEKSDEPLYNWAKLTIERNDTKFYRLPSVAKSGLTEVVGERGVMGWVKDKWERFKKRGEGDEEFGTDLSPETEQMLRENNKQLYSILNMNPENEGSALGGAMKRIVAIATNERGEERHNVPVNFRYDISQEEQSFDLPSIMLLNHYMSRNFENKSEIIHDLELMRDFLTTRGVEQNRTTVFQGVQKLINSVKGNIGEEQQLTPIVKSGIDSHALKAFESMLQDRGYGIARLGNYTINKMADFLASYTGSVMLIGNYMSAGANMLSGTTFNWLEGIGGTFFSKSDLSLATWKYTKDMVNITQDLGKRVHTSKTNLLMEKFNNTGDWSAVAKRFVDDTRFKQLFKAGTLHLLNNTAEHAIQNTLLYAVLSNIKVMDAHGNYLTRTGTTEDVNEAMSLDEAYTVAGNKLVLDPRVSKTTNSDVIDLNDSQEAAEFQISRQVRDLNAYLQGEYSWQKRAQIQREWYGVLIMLLRKWMPRGMSARFRSIGNFRIPTKELKSEDRFYSRALTNTYEGYYTTTARFVTTMLRELKRLKWHLLTADGIKQFRAVGKGEYKLLNDWEQGNIRKTIYEAGLVIAFSLMATALKGLGDDDKDKTAKKFYYSLAFYSLRLSKELSTYFNPNEFLNTLRTPSVSIIMINRLMGFLMQLGIDVTSVATGGEFEKYKTGRKEGQLKLEKRWEDLIPLMKNLDRDIQEALSWFMTRRVY